MKKGVIIYSKERFAVNVFFADSLKENLEKLGLKTEIVLDEFKIECNTNSDNKIDFAVMRKEGFAFSKKLEKCGVKVFNNSFVSKICNDKFLTMEFLKKSKIDSMPYKLIDKSNYKVLTDSFPKIVKSRYGHGGKQVFMVNNFEDISNAFIKTKEKNLILQDVASNLGKDLRVYVFDNQIFKAILRENLKDFRSNYTLGGNIKEYNLSQEEKNIVNEIIKLFSFDFVGIDFIFNDGKIVFNEIEDIVGARMLYAFNIDAAKIYAEYIQKKICN